MATTSELNAALDAFRKKKREQESELSERVEAIRTEVADTILVFSTWLKGLGDHLSFIEGPEILTTERDGIFYKVPTKKITVGFAQQEFVIAPVLDDDLQVSFRVDGFKRGSFSLRRSSQGWNVYSGNLLTTVFTAGYLRGLMMADIPGAPR